MAKDYKNRAQRSRKKTPQASVSAWKWLTVFILIALFVYFLVFLRSLAGKDEAKQLAIPVETPSQQSQAAAKSKEAKKPPEPRFDFYTILPEKEVVVPDHEIKTRTREEQVGKTKAVIYLLQAGSFRDYKEADKLKAQLALMGIESTIEKAQIGDTIWNRIKIGPFKNLSRVNSIRAQLRANHIDVVVMEKSG